MNAPRTPRPSARPVLIRTGLLLVLVPPLVFGGVGLAEGMGFGGTLGALAAQYQTRRLNLLGVALLSFLPLLLLTLLVFLLGRFTAIRASPRSLALGGAVAIVAVTVWINLQFWPVFLPERRTPGFPHGLEFVIGPLYFAPVAMLVGLGIAALLDRSRR